MPDAAESVFHVLSHAAANPDHGIRRIPGDRPTDDSFQVE
jgi:hypothetical protein